jgi:hypothetical protein
VNLNNARATKLKLQQEIRRCHFQMEKTEVNKLFKQQATEGINFLI